MKKNIIPFLLVSSLFLMWGLANNMNDTLLAAFKRILSISDLQSSLVQFAFYGAYFCFAIPASLFIQRFSYKAGILLGLSIYALGTFLFYPAGASSSYLFFLIAIYIMAGGCAILETSANPYILAMGDEKTATRRLNIAQTFNPVGALGGILLSQYFILSSLHQADAEDRAGMSPEILKAIQHSEFNAVSETYIIIGTILLVLLLVIFFSKMPSGLPNSTLPTPHSSLPTPHSPLPIPHSLLQTPNSSLHIPYSSLQTPNSPLQTPNFNNFNNSSNSNNFNNFNNFNNSNNSNTILSRLMKNPAYLRGVITQFFYVGAQTCVWSFTIRYVMDIKDCRESEASYIFLWSIIAFTFFRFLFTWLMKYVKAAKLMAWCACFAIAATCIVIFSDGDFSIIALIAISACMSLMFPTIYAISLENVEPEDRKLGASGLIMAILGGALITPLQGLVSDSFGISPSFIVSLFCFAIVFIYSLFNLRSHEG